LGMASSQDPEAGSGSQGYFVVSGRTVSADTPRKTSALGGGYVEREQVDAMPAVRG